jgi:16S rRNA U1498 N3-methylase RsmE
MFGVSSLNFVRSELGEKSYLQSRALDADQLEEETVKALEQVWDSRAPEVVVHRTFSYFLENKLSEISTSLTAQSPEAELARFVAHPGGISVGCEDVNRLKNAPAIIAIGPERGWSDGEVRAFSDGGFQVLGLGEQGLIDGYFQTTQELKLEIFQPFCRAHLGPWNWNGCGVNANASHPICTLVRKN